MTAQPTSRVSRRLDVLVHIVLGLLAVAVVVAAAPESNWKLPLLAVIGAFTVISGLTYDETSNSDVNIQGTPIGLLLAGVLLGPGPAACLGAFTVCCVQLRLRSPSQFFLNNVVTFAWFPLAGALAFHGLTHSLGLGQGDIAFYALIIPTFLLGISLNFLGVVGHLCWLKHSPVLVAVRETFVPMIWVELLASLLTIGAAWMTLRTGALGMALLGGALLVFQRLAGELLKSKSRAGELHRLATTDGLTGLVNRTTFVSELSKRAGSADARSAFTVSLLDLDGFKEINDTLGHHYGDELLREIAQRLKACVGESGMVARLGGDEFVVLSTEATDEPEAILGVAQRLGDCAREPIQVDEIVVTVGSSIGIARFPQDGDDVNELMRRADVAMYAAKDGQSGVKLYAPELDHHSVQRLGLLGELSRALENNELVVHFQPIIGGDDFATKGAECLVRWQHPEHGLLPPAAFIDSIEQTPLIHPLTLIVLERAIDQCARWNASGRNLFVAVNLSVRNLHNPNLPNEIAVLLRRYGLPPAALKLEITESTIMADLDLVSATIDQLRGLGVGLSIDDFGTGFSSLAYLKNLPIVELKIDRSFVSSMLTDESGLIIVRSIINLGHDLGLEVVAEGVEDAETLLRLSSLGCDLIQGFHVSRPVPAEELTAWMAGPSSGPSPQSSSVPPAWDSSAPAASVAAS